MTLNYPMTQSGMYVISKDDFDNIATDILKEYLPNTLEHPQPTNIEYLAQECLYLDLRYEYISSDGSLLGAIAYSDTTFEGLDIFLRPTTFSLSEGTVLIDSRLSYPEKLARRRFTMAHECGHWVCHRTYHSPNNKKYEFRKNNVITCRSNSIERYKYMTPKTDEEWQEWQADHFAASILMPIQTFELFARQAIRGAGIQQEYLVNGQDKAQAYEAIEQVAKRFSVSKRAAQIRMQQLGLIIDNRYSSLI